MNFNSDQQRRVAIVGAGALGLYVGIRLAVAGYDVGFLLRSDMDDVKRDGLRLTLVDGLEMRLREPRIATKTEELAPADCVIVAMKTTHTHLLADLLQPLVGDNTCIITLQNGLGNVELLERHFPGRAVLGVLCQIGVNREAPGYVRSFVPKDGSVQVGAGTHASRELAEEWTERFKHAGIQARTAASLGEALWRKLMWNVPFNGLTVAAGAVATDVVCQDRQLRELAHALMEELRMAANAMGHSIEDGFSEKLLSFTDQMGPYLSSSVLDWRADRPIEVEAIFLNPLQAGLKAGMQMPHLQTLCAVLHGLQLEQNRAKADK